MIQSTGAGGTVPKDVHAISLELGQTLHSMEKELCRYDLDYRCRIGRGLELVGGRRDAAGGEVGEIPSVTRS